MPDEPSPPGDRAPRVPARLPKSLGELALESGMIVLSVLLALAASSWADARKQRHVTEQARESFVREIRANRSRLDTVLVYHRELTDSVRRIDSTGGVASYGEWKRRVPVWSGFRPPDLTATAWQSALATGALANLPYREVETLSSLYTVQGKLDAFNATYIPTMDFADAAMPSTIRRMNAYMQTVVSYEGALRRESDGALAVLDAGAGGR